MDRCTTYQSQMLEYLYDLLDDGARQEAGVHLLHCAACQAALRAAREQQQLLSAAARLEFPSVRFVPPESEAVETVPVENEVLPLPARPALRLTGTLTPRARRRGPSW